MPDDKKDLEEQEEETKEEETPSPAEAEKADKENFVPKSRFNELNTKLKESQARLATVEKEQASQLEKQLVEQGKHKELAEERAKKIAELQPKADQVDAYEKSLVGVLEAQTEDIPEQMRDLIPSEYTTQQKLDWIAQNRSKLMKPLPPDLKAGKRGGEENGSADLNSEELAMASTAGMTAEEYAKYKDKE